MASKKVRNAVVTDFIYRDVNRKKYRQLVIQYEDGSGDMVRIPVKESRAI